MGEHDAPVNGVFYVPGLHNSVISTSYDGKAKVWDLRQLDPATQLDYKNKILDASVNDKMMVVALSTHNLVVSNLEDCYNTR